MTAPAAVLLVVTIAAAAIDVRSRRIPNALTAAAAVAVLAVHAPEGATVELTSVAAMLAAFVPGRSHSRPAGSAAVT